jgi:hypothetical protein
MNFRVGDTILLGGKRITTERSGDTLSTIFFGNTKEKVVLLKPYHVMKWYGKLTCGLSCVVHLL